MKHKLLALPAALLAAAFMLFAAVDDAEAGRGYHRGHHGGHFRHFSGPRFHSFRHARPGFHLHFGAGPRRFHRGFVYGGLPLATFGHYYHRSGCGWLKRRAVHTGSRYWWRRYAACRRGFY